jgi:glycosyltransferase involved in cell wall biosynthesis
MSAPRVLVPRLRMPWWSPSSGYDQLAERLACQVVLPSRRLAPLAASRLAYPIARARCPLPWYPRDWFEVELQLLWATARRKGGVVHLLASEGDLWFTRHVRHFGGRLVATYHAPPALLRDRMEVRHWRTCLAAVDRVVIVSDSQRAFFAEYLPDDRILTVPHGVDTEVFAPGPDVADTPPLCLTVGHWLRDVSVLAGVYALLRAEWGSRLRLVVVCAEEFAEEYRSVGHGVEIRTSVPEPDLVALYRAASVVLLPLTDATANNALLEAMACGRAVVATDVGGTAEYLGPAGVLAPPGDVAAHAAAVQGLLHDPERRRALGAAARRRADRFAWPRGAARLADVHGELLSRPVDR